jgi:hypothetical protein
MARRVLLRLVALVFTVRSLLALKPIKDKNVDADDSACTYNARNQHRAEQSRH